MTVQLRRYDVGADGLDAFVAWWRGHLVPARRAAGFEIEFAFTVPSTGEFVWAVRIAGDAEAFAAAEQRYLRSPEREQAMHRLPAPVLGQDVHEATPVGWESTG